jgi:hypothetical protein
MIILSKWRNLSLPAQASLSLTAYSFDDRELSSIPRVLERSKIEQIRIEDVSKMEERADNLVLILKKSKNLKNRWTYGFSLIAKATLSLFPVGFSEVSRAPSKV